MDDSLKYDKRILKNTKLMESPLSESDLNTYLSQIEDTQDQVVLISDLFAQREAEAEALRLAEEEAQRQAEAEAEAQRQAEAEAQMALQEAEGGSSDEFTANEEAQDVDSSNETASEESETNVHSEE